MNIPSAPRLVSGVEYERSRVEVPLIFDSYGLSEQEFVKNASFGRAYFYNSLPFHLARFDASAVIVESGIVFDTSTMAAHEATIYHQSPDRDAHVTRSVSGDGYIVNEWWAKLAQGNLWRKFDFGRPVVVSWHRYCGVYTHFLVEFLFSIWKHTSDNNEAWRWPVIVSGGISPYQLGALQALGINTNIVSVPHNAIVCGDLLIPSALFAKTWIHPDVADFGVHCRLALSSPTLSAPEKIYISRASATARKMENEKELEARLSEAGFAILTLEGLSFKEQVALFSRAKVIVAPHGSGLANVIFAPPGCMVLELTSYGFEGRWPLQDGSFRRLCHIAGHGYGLVTFANSPSSKSWRVDVNAIMSTLKSWA